MAVVGITAAKSQPIYSPPRLILDSDSLSKFDCGKQSLDDWLKNNSNRAEGKSARTYVVCKRTSENSEPVVAYYSLATGSVFRDQCLGNIRRNMPDPVPVMILARLAVDKDYAGKGLGKALLKDALTKVVEISEIAGVAAILLHAVDDDALAFYTQYGFRAFPVEGRTMFLPIETVKKGI